MPELERDPAAKQTHVTSALLDMTALGQEGHAWIVDLPAGFGPGDTPEAMASRWVLYENDQELGPAHAQHDVIRQSGGGAYSHWHDKLYFSTSDGSDPRTNGRTYRLADKPLRLAVIGLDGANLTTLRGHIAEGRLPNIARLLERSREVEVRSESELFINSFWPCFASGHAVGSHGIHAFRPPRSGTMQLVEGHEQRTTTPFWETAARHGIRTCVLDAPFYGPPAAEPGLERLSYVEWGPHPPVRPPGSLPADLIGHVVSRYGPYPCPLDLPSLPTVEDSADEVALLCIGARKRAAVIGELIRMTSPELLVVVFPELHTAGHQWLNKETPDHRCYDAALMSALGSPTRQVHEAVDRAIGRVVDQLPPETTVLLACLGGLQVTHGGSNLLSDLLDRLCFSAAPGDQPEGGSNIGQPRIESPPGLLLDWSKTRAFALPWAYDGYLRINQRGREPGGIVANGAEREKILAQIERAVRAMRIAGTDQPAAKAIVRAQEEFPGAASAMLPDLMVLWKNERPFNAIESEFTGRIENRDLAGRAKHVPEGAVFGYGPLIATGQTVRGGRDYDIAPTILSLLDVPVPDGLDGRALSELKASAARLRTRHERNRSVCRTK